MTKDQLFSRPCPTHKGWLVLNSQGEIYPFITTADGAWTGQDGARNYIEALAGPVYGPSRDETMALIESGENYDIAFNHAEKVKQNYALFLYEPKGHVPDALEYWSGQECDRRPGTLDSDWEMKDEENFQAEAAANPYASIDFTNLS